MVKFNGKLSVAKTLIFQRFLFQLPIKINFPLPLKWEASHFNSILNRATQAKNLTGEKQIQEQIRLAVAGAIANGNGSISDVTLLTDELDKYFGTNGYEITDNEDSWDVVVGSVTENVSKSGSTGGGNNTLVLTAIDRATESRAAVIEVSVAAGTLPTETELQAKSQEELKPMFVAAIQQLGAPFATWNDIPNVTSTTTIEDVFTQFNLSSQGYTNAYDLIIQTGAYAEPATFTLNGETITGASAEFVVTKNSSSDTSYTISAIQGSNSGSVTANVTKCKIEEYSSICENNTNLKVGTNGLEPASSGDTIVAVCPAGFAYGTSANVGTISKGLVITDSVDSDGYSNGNEFVWIPVDKTSLKVVGTEKAIAAITSGQTNGLDNYQGKLYDFSGTTSTEKSSYGQSTTSYREPATLSSYDTDSQSYLSGIGLTASQFSTEMQEQYNKFIQSVQTYGGFYVGRYEMGKGTGNFSKIGVTPTSASTDDENMWYGLYNKAKSYSKSSITAGMIWGSQYDAMLNFGLTNSSDSSKITANTNGNHSGKLLKTGTWLGSNTTNPETDKINNIFDLEGNMWEWTKEAYYTNYRVRRGGGLGYSDLPSDRNSNYDPNLTDTGNGSRLGLYIK